MSPSHEVLDYRSTVEIASKTTPGVTFEVFRLSVQRRAEIARRVVDKLAWLEYLEAGEARPGERLDAMRARQEVTALYLEWGLAGVKGLRLDGEEPTAERLLQCGPEGLCEEIAESVKQQLGLSEEERKN